MSDLDAIRGVAKPLIPVIEAQFARFYRGVRLCGIVKPALEARVALDAVSSEFNREIRAEQTASRDFVNYLAERMAREYHDKKCVNSVVDSEKSFCRLMMENDANGAMSSVMKGEDAQPTLVLSGKTREKIHTVVRKLMARLDAAEVYSSNSLDGSMIGVALPCTDLRLNGMDLDRLQRALSEPGKPGSPLGFLCLKAFHDCADRFLPV